MAKSKYYTIYLNATDEIIASGSAIHCATMLNKSLESFYCLVSRSRLGRIRKYTVCVDTLDCDEVGGDSADIDRV